MTNKQSADFLQEKILDILKSRDEAKTNPDRKIVTVNVDAELFLKMAYLFVATYGTWDVSALPKRGAAE